jgi:glycosyltransferase involved in cell wall biosynthesis
VKVCVLVHNPVASDGRVIRQADALAGAGYDVTVLGVRNPGAPPTPEWLRQRSWRLVLYNRDRLSPVGRINWFKTALRSHAAERLSRVVASGYGSANALVRALPELVRAAAAERAALYVANDLTMLPVACAAAEAVGARVIYDVHDLYTEEDANHAPWQRELIATVEGAYIHRAAAVLSASGGFLEPLRDLYGVDATVIHNVPPLEWSAADALQASQLASPRPPRQRLAVAQQGILGFGNRGLEDILGALPRVDPAVEFHFRGFIQPDALRALGEAAAHHPGRVHVHPAVPPAELMRAQRDFDVGLITTNPTSRGNILAVPNKLFEYMHAGLAVVASAMPFMARIVEETGAGLVYEGGSAESLAAAINALAADRPQLAALRSRALEAAVSEHNWEREREKLLAVVARVLGGAADGRRRRQEAVEA